VEEPEARRRLRRSDRRDHVRVDLDSNHHA
jgi:hypothetical protein